MNRKVPLMTKLMFASVLMATACGVAYAEMAAVDPARFGGSTLQSDVPEDYSFTPTMNHVIGGIGIAGPFSTDFKGPAPTMNGTGNDYLLDAGNVDPTKTGAIAKPTMSATDPKSQNAMSASAKDAASQKICGHSAAEAGKIAGSDASMDSTITKAGGSATPECKAALKKTMQACAAGDSAGATAAKDEAATACAPGDGKSAEVNTPTPHGAAAPTVTQATQNVLQQAQQKIAGLLGGANGAGGGMIQNMLSQVAGNMISQKLQSMLSGGSGSSDSSGSSGSGSSGSGYTPTPTCDRVTGTETANQVGVSSGVTVTTVMTTDTCANGYHRVSTAIKLEYPDGSVINHNSDPVIK